MIQFRFILMMAVVFSYSVEGVAFYTKDATTKSGLAESQGTLSDATAFTSFASVIASGGATITKFAFDAIKGNPKLLNSVKTLVKEVNGKKASLAIAKQTQNPSAKLISQMKDLEKEIADKVGSLCQFGVTLH